jgi:hypothetical protein
MTGSEDTGREKTEARPGKEQPGTRKLRNEKKQGGEEPGEDLVSM